MFKMYSIIAVGVLLSACNGTPSLSAQHKTLQRIDEMAEQLLSGEEQSNLESPEFSPPGTFITDVFPDYVQTFDLTEEEVVMIGEWPTVIGRTGSGSYVFLPNRLFIYSMSAQDSSGNRVTSSIGEWWIEDGVIMAAIQGYLWRDESWDSATQEQFFARVEPVDYVIGRTSYVNDFGVTTRPFLAIDFQDYLDRGFSPRDSTDFEPELKFRLLYNRPWSDPSIRYYEYLNVVFAMEDRGISKDEFLESDELIEAMVSRQEWVIDRRLEALGL